jgi:hypothetical protein
MKDFTLEEFKTLNHNQALARLLNCKQKDVEPLYEAAKRYKAHFKATVSKKPYTLALTGEDDLFTVTYGDTYHVQITGQKITHDCATPLDAVRLAFAVLAVI